ncbi:MAG: hypothetical protein CMC08_03080 [Flavobacteriaceae bacterium]|nr:hypothetical protein [Flavobacteriaceae bacterium]
MKPTYLLTAFAVCAIVTFSSAQVGIGTVNPNASSVLDIQSTTKGLLAPRMTTAQRNAIASPAESLLVFDTELDAFYFYNTTTSSWTKLNNAAGDKRNNYKLVKSAADLAPELAAGGGSKYMLTSNTLYEINGLIALTAPIDLNDAYVSGLDANEDILSFAGGTVFSGNTGGSIRNVTLKGARAFNFTGPGITSPSSLLIQNTIVDGMTTNVGTVNGFGLYFGNIVQFINNASGITYSNIGNLLLNNQAWLASNNGTFETFTGTFGLIEKVSGFSSVDASDIAIDVSSNPIVANGVILGTVFSGTTSAPSGYIKRYTTGSFTGYNFTNNWTVNCPGLPRESDDVATGTIFIQRNSTSSNPSFNISGSASVEGITDASNLFRMSRTVGALTNNILQYSGKKTRTFSVSGTLSYQPTQNTGGLTSSIHAFYLRRYDENGLTVAIPLGTEVYEEANDNDVRAIPLSGTIVLNPGDYVRVFGQLISGNRNMIRAYSLSLTLE